MASRTSGEREGSVLLAALFGTIFIGCSLSMPLEVRASGSGTKKNPVMRTSAGGQVVEHPTRAVSARRGP
ncbi:MAG: hypothetical protein QI223_06370 [Candidatus Korarchaeota archaeon]|nr:hypothetical protein [Candidatus Korarchaeota archaeon]